MPTEVHEHFDADGNLTGRTVITRESEWDDETRARALRLAEYESNLCGCGCGQPLDVAYDKRRAFKVDTVTCYAGRALESVRRADRAKAETEKKPDGWDDGLHYYVIPHDDDNHDQVREVRHGD